MADVNKDHDVFHGFSKLTESERFERLLRTGLLTQEAVTYLQQGGVKGNMLADRLIENVIGYFQLPLGIATHFRIDNKEYVIPLAVEETSIIAALSKTAKWIKNQGKITTEITGRGILGQIQLAKVKDFKRFEAIFSLNKTFLIEKANEEVALSMVKRGGGVFDLTLKHLRRPDGGDMAIIHLLMDSCDAMGANIINQVLEFLKTPIENLTGEHVTMCILSNLNDHKLTTASVEINHIDSILGERIQEASLFAELDPYRAATHNKGVMNGMDAVLIATGNDWRSVEAGIHAYAAREGQYKTITTWRYQDGKLIGKLTAPVVVGTVGGVTSLHPTAKICLDMMKITHANELSRVVAAVGLVQNLGALKALCTEGIIKGHMKLHLDNILSVAGASEEERPLLKKLLQKCILQKTPVTLSIVSNMLAEMRKAHFAV